MTGLRSRLRHHDFGGLLLAGLILAVFLYLIVPLVFPGLFVVWALVGAAFVGLAAMGRPHLRRRNVRRKILYPPRPQKSAFGSRRVDPFEKELACILAATVAGVLLFSFEAGAILYQDLVLWTDYRFFTALGVAVDFLGFCLLLALRDVPGTRWDQDYFSQVDTAEDH